MSPGLTAMQRMLTDADFDIALTKTAEMFGLQKSTVTTIVQIGLPMMARMAGSNPVLFQRMHAVSLSPLPEPIHDYYARMAGDAALRQATMDDYRATFGTMLDAVNREAGRQAGTTDGQAREVIAAALPAVGLSLSEAMRRNDREAFAKVLRKLA